MEAKRRSFRPRPDRETRASASKKLVEEFAEGKHEVQRRSVRPGVAASWPGYPETSTVAVAQSVEPLVVVQVVVGSSPIRHPPA
jgi:hypothetical protein